MAIPDHNCGIASNPITLPATTESARPGLWYPKAIRCAEIPTSGPYENGWPRGAVIHATKGRFGLSALDMARTDGMTYLLIDGRGQVHQGFPLDRWGCHAGTSSWRGIDGRVSRHLVGINIECAGRLQPLREGGWRTWWGEVVPADEVRNVSENQNWETGAYRAFRPAQEKALVELLIWLKASRPDVFDFGMVVGADECTQGRRCDPGASLSLTMPDFRALLVSQYLQSLPPAEA